MYTHFVCALEPGLKRTQEEMQPPYILACYMTQSTISEISVPVLWAPYLAVVLRTLLEDTHTLTSCGTMWWASYGRLAHILTKEAGWGLMLLLLRWISTHMFLYNCPVIHTMRMNYSCLSILCGLGCNLSVCEESCYQGCYGCVPCDRIISSQQS